MPSFTLNGNSVEFVPGDTILQAAERVGVKIPHFCYHPGLSRPANCRMCLVDVERAPKLLPGCYTEVSDGMVVNTENQRVDLARRSILEFILINHPVDCPICDQAGECKLQDLYFGYSCQESRLSTPKTAKVKAFPFGPDVVYDGERCILCTRCVRFTEEISKSAQLGVINRDDQGEIRPFPGLPFDDDYSLCTVDLCPVGALTDRNFRFKCRVWMLHTTPSLCTGCARGCNVHLDHFKNEAQRYRPRYNQDVNSFWMCDHGRHSLRRVHQERLLGPIVLDDDEQREVSRAKALLAARELLRDAGSKRVAFVLSPQSSCEQLYATFDFAKKWAEQGTQPSFFMAGQPETAFCLRVDPENLGEQAKCPIDKKVSDDFLICADKNPNRAGLLALAQHFGVELQPAEALLDAIDGLDLLCVFGADLPFDEAQLDRLDEGLAETKLLYLGSHQGLLADMADVALPVCTHVEESGSFINVQGLRQHYEAAFEPHGLSQSYHQWLGSIAKKLGLRGALEEPAALRAATDKALKA